MLTYSLRNITANMEQFYKIVRSDYLQRTRSYAFLITLAVSLYATYSFIPPHQANYTTVQISGYIGVNNAAWTGYVAAMMTSVFLSITGFYLVNSGIKKDMDTGVGMIIATTPVSNFSYLLSKAWSNFMVLLSITGLIFLMSIAVFLFRAEGYPFEILKFIMPFVLITMPAIFFISSLAVVAEVFLYRYTVLVNVAYFCLFIPLMLASQPTLNPVFDVLGIKTITMGMENIISQHFHVQHPKVGMGFLIGHKKEMKLFIFEGLHWTSFYVLIRFSWMIAGFALVYISSLFFHRFNIKERVKKQKKVIKGSVQDNHLSALPGQSGQPHGLPSVSAFKALKEIKLSALPKIAASYGISPFIKTELLMLFRKGPRWMWLINLGGMTAMIFVPVAIAHLWILPSLWFLQVARWSDLATKEKTYRIHYFTYASYKPLSRLFSAQILAGIILSVTLAAPLMVRYMVTMQFLPVLTIVLGAVFIVFFAVLTGMVSGGKKLFEILFFALTYSNVNKAPALDYFGAMAHGSYYVVDMIAVISCLAVASFLWRKQEIRRL